MPRFLFVVFVLCASLVAQPAFARPDSVIPPGAEAEVLALLGPASDRPGGCLRTAVHVEARAIRAEYVCSGRATTLHLVHPDAGGSHRSRSFALRFEGDAPTAFVEAIANGIASRDHGFPWMRPNATARPTSSRGTLRFAPSKAFGALLAIVAFGALASFGWRRAPKDDRSTTRTVVSVATTAGVALLLLIATMPEPPIHPDSSRDLLLGIEFERGRGTVGPAASLAGWFHGTLWPRWLGALRSAGASVATIGRLHLAMVCLGAAIVGIGVRTELGRRGAVVACALFVAAAVRTIEAPVLFGASLVPLPLAIASLTWLHATRRDRALVGFVAGVAFAVAAEGHLVVAPFALTAPSLAYVAGASGRVALATLGGTLVTFGIASPMVLTRNVGTIPPGFVAFGGVVMALGTVLARRVFAGGSSAERLAVACRLHATAGVGIALVIAGFADVGSDRRYAATALVPCVVLGALAVAALRSRMVSRCVVAFALLSLPWHGDVRERARFGYGDVERIATVLRAGGTGYDAWRRDLVMPWYVLGALGPMAGDDVSRRPRPGPPRAIVKIPRTYDAPPGIVTRPAEDGRFALWWIPTEDLLDRDRPRACRSARHGGEAICVTLAALDDAIDPVQRAYPSREELETEGEGPGRAEVVQSFPLRRDPGVPMLAIALDPDVTLRYGPDEGRVVRLPPALGTVRTLDALRRSDPGGHAPVPAWPAAIAIVREGVLPAAWARPTDEKANEDRDR